MSKVFINDQDLVHHTLQTIVPSATLLSYIKMIRYDQYDKAFPFFFCSYTEILTIVKPTPCFLFSWSGSDVAEIESDTSQDR